MAALELYLPDGKLIRLFSDGNDYQSTIQQVGQSLSITGGGSGGVGIQSGSNLTFLGNTHTIGGTSSILTIGNPGDTVNIEQLQTLSAVDSIIFDIGGVTEMVLTSTGLSINNSDSPSVALQIGSGSPTDLASGIQFGTDVNLYRIAANTLYTPNSFSASGVIYAGGGSGIVYASTFTNSESAETKIGSYNASGYTTLYSSAGETLRVTGGAVGIGTSGPISRLEVATRNNSSGNNDAARLGRITIGNTYNGYAQLGDGFYIDGSTFRYRYNDTVTRLDMTNGHLAMYHAVAGTTGDPITFYKSLVVQNDGVITRGVYNMTKYFDGVTFSTSGMVRYIEFSTSIPLAWSNFVIRVTAFGSNGSTSSSGIKERIFAIIINDSGTLNQVKSEITHAIGNIASSLTIGDPIITDGKLRIPLNSTAGSRSFTIRMDIAGSASDITNLKDSIITTEEAGTTNISQYPTIHSRLGIGLTESNMPTEVLEVNGNIKLTSTSKSILSGEVFKLASDVGGGIQFQGHGYGYGQVALISNTIDNSNPGYSTISTALSATQVVLPAGSWTPDVFKLQYIINNSAAQTSSIVTGLKITATETNLNSATHNLLDCQVGGTSKFKVRGTGEIGINCTPESGALLDITNSSLIYLGMAHAVLRMASSTNTLWLEGYTNDRTGTIANIAFAGYNGSNRTFDIDLANNRVGVNTATPSEALEVVGNARITGSNTTSLYLKATTNDSDVKISLGDNNTDTKGALIYAGASGPYLGLISYENNTPIRIFTTYNSTVSEVFRIDANGRVGINNYGPSETLDITGTMAVSEYILIDGQSVLHTGSNLGELADVSAAIPTDGYVLTWNDTTDMWEPQAAPGAGGGISGSGTANYISKFTGTASLGNSLLYESTSYLGIGTTTPGTTLPSSFYNNSASRLLQISSNSTSSDAGLFLRNSDDTEGLDIWCDSSLNTAYIDSRLSTARIKIRTQTASTPVEALIINADGSWTTVNSVTIGTTTEDNYLQVTGARGNTEPLLSLHNYSGQGGIKFWTLRSTTVDDGLGLIDWWGYVSDVPRQYASMLAQVGNDTNTGRISLYTLVSGTMIEVMRIEGDTLMAGTTNEIWHAGNDGASSGLDADLLDGNHASAFALSGHDHSGVYEPTFSKNTAFNKNFGTSLGTVSEGNHTHSIYASITHDHDSDYAPLVHDHDETYSLIDHTHSGVYEPVFTKNTAFNKNFGTGATDVSAGNHQHAKLEFSADPTNHYMYIAKTVSEETEVFIANEQTDYGVGIAVRVNDQGDVEIDPTGSTINIVSTNLQHNGTAVALDDHTHSVVIPHTYAIPGEIKVPSGDTDYILPFFVSVPTGQTVKIIKAMHRINSGTSATVKLQKNGTTDITGFTSISVTTTTGTTDPADQTLANNDMVQLIVTAVDGTPKNMTFTIFVEYTF